MIIKVDMSKAFDRVEWSFLSQVLSAFGFKDQLIELIMAQLKDSWFTVSLHGLKEGFFSATRGLR